MRQLNTQEMAQLEGGFNWVRAVDVGCAVAGAAVVFGFGIGLAGEIFCAGWAVGRLFS